jgi:hypothetical protein
MKLNYVDRLVVTLGDGARHTALFHVIVKPMRL